MDLADWGKIMLLKLIIVSYWKVNVNSNILPRCILFITTFIGYDIFGDRLMVAEYVFKN